MIEVNMNYRQKFSRGVCSEGPGVTESWVMLPIERESGGATPRNRSNHLKWEMLALWSFVVFSFAALTFSIYIMWTKIHADSPF